MSYHKEQRVQPVLSNYLLPRGQRFWAEFPENRATQLDPKWGKKSEITTNISEVPPIDSHLHSQEHFSLFHSVDDYENQPLGSPLQRDFYDMKKSPRGARKKTNKFKLEDYDFVDATDEISDFDSRIESFEVSRDPGHSFQGRARRFGKQKQISQKNASREQRRQNELAGRGGERLRHFSNGHPKIGNSGRL